MILAAHAIAGGVTGEIVGNPLLAFLVGFILHFLLDALPHFDDLTNGGEFNRKQWIYSIAEFSLGLLIIFLVLKPSISLSNPFFWGMAGCLLPDIEYVPFWKKSLRKIKRISLMSRVYRFFHVKMKPGFAIGMTVNS